MPQHQIAFKPLLLRVPTEREAVYTKLKGHMKTLERLINDPSTDDKMKLKAMALYVRVANVARGVLSDYERDKIRFELEELAQQIEDSISERAAEQAAAKREGLAF